MISLLSSTLTFLYYSSTLFLLSVILSRLCCFWRRRSRRKLVVGLFHPYCNDGGGGERVLWKTVVALSEASRGMVDIVIYSGDQNITGTEILKNAYTTFGIEVQPEMVRFVFLRSRFLVEASLWPRFTILGQSVGSFFLGLEALLWCCPDVFFDTMGYSFTYPVFSLLGGSQVAAYVHYPTISSDMLRKVSSAEESFNNKGLVSSSPLLTQFKSMYYRFFFVLYSVMGWFPSLVTANSSWTKHHIEYLWNRQDVNLVFPPVDCSGLKALPSSPRKDIIVSVAQFRPEKNHKLQIKVFAQFLAEVGRGDIQLVLIGSVRKNNQGDVDRVQALRKLSNELGVESQVQIKVGVSNDELKEWLGCSLCGLHTMSDEHFGISVVELMAAGVIPIANNSAGPKEDIVVPFQGERTGYLCTTQDEYVRALVEIFCHRAADSRNKSMQTAARASVSKFSEQYFANAIVENLSKVPLLKKVLMS
eukprot:TRINITY_DN10870_c0_g1_i1.p1 TRINITY_DN10870_c0_g1~~TRINITY_DN10870_c0_g1_i1.p1  ORF type:complete len:475 (+),score=74.19 TRINITY_DN10870_c0_g1_i1:3-1427(+)